MVALDVNVIIIIIINNNTAYDAVVVTINPVQPMKVDQRQEKKKLPTIRLR